MCTRVLLGLLWCPINPINKSFSSVSVLNISGLRVFHVRFNSICEVNYYFLQTKISQCRSKSVPKLILLTIGHFNKTN